MNENDTEISVGGTKTFSEAGSVIIGVDFGEELAVPALSFTNDTDTGMWRSSGSSISFSIGNSSVDDVYDLFFKGKTIKDNSDEYMDVIMRLPGVEQSQLDAIETLEFFRKQFFPEGDEL
jgi:hypothetical protein